MASHALRAAGFSTAAVLVAALFTAPTAQAVDEPRTPHTRPTRVTAMAPVEGTPAPPTPTENLRRSQGYLVPDQQAYEAAKAAAAAESTAAVNLVSESPTAPREVINFAGVRDTTGTPSDSTGAIGTTRYIETVNSRYEIYNRSGGSINSGTLQQLVGSAASDNVFDPQIIWDATTSRFYYTADDIDTFGNNLLALGFSRTASPSGPADFCQYVLNYGIADFPDYPKLGDTKDFFVIGVNVFDAFSSNFLGSDIIALTKPVAGSTCPDPATIGVTIKSNIKNPNGSQAFTPVPGNQIDTAEVGWVVAIPGTPGDYLSLFKVKKSASGAAAISKSSKVKVPTFTIAPSAPQKDSSRTIDTLDGRNTQAILAVDPRLDTVALWTQHTVQGGAGAQVRWYEIDPAARSILQRDKVTNKEKYIFNGAISSDRLVDGATSAFGANMVVNVTTSSTSSYPDIEVVSKRGGDPQSRRKVVVTSPGPAQDFGCGAGETCRWGDYAAATPDPKADLSAAAGVVWGTNQYTKDGRINPSGVNWLTRNFAYRP